MMTDSARLARANAMALLYGEGRTLKEIGDQYGMTRERVRQILKLTAVTAADGGAAVRCQKRVAARLQARDARYLEKYGCTLAVRRTVPSAARAAFKQQHMNAKNRGIEWQLKFWDWWTIWQRSGHWDERGRLGDNYVMCRYGDIGPYALGNVYIATARDNMAESWLIRRARAA